MSAEARLQKLSQDYQKYQEEYSVAVTSRARLDAQKSENEAVKKEFDILTPTNQVYKLVGPILMKQDQSEAKANVDKRLEFIGGEITRVEGTLKDVNAKLEKTKLEIVKTQGELQQQQAQQAVPAGPGAPRLAPPV